MARVRPWGQYRHQYLDLKLRTMSNDRVAGSAASPAQLREQVRTLEIALHSNRVIGVATGVLMVTHNLCESDAFSLLRDASQRLNVKLREVADGVVETGALRDEHKVKINQRGTSGLLHHLEAAAAW